MYYKPVYTVTFAKENGDFLANVLVAGTDFEKIGAKIQAHYEDVLEDNPGVIKIQSIMFTGELSVDC